MNHKTKIFLTISVLLNLLLAGMAAGMLCHEWQENPMHHMQGLSPQTRDLLTHSYQAAREEMTGTFKEMRDARKQINAVLKADTFDGKAFEAAAERMQKAQKKMIDRKIEIMKEIAPQIPPQERQKLSDNLMRPYKKGDHKFGPPGGSQGDHAAAGSTAAGPAKAP